MKSSNGNVSNKVAELRDAVRFALASSAGAIAALNSSPAVSADTPTATTANENQSLEEVIVTGTRIRRVDTETASPVVTISEKEIQQSGAVNIQDLIARLPAVSGAAINPQTNNGGGFGEANIELRGLDARRTLILVDGRRLGLVGNSDATDVSQIPVSMIERVEVLKEGAGAIYGSDAIGGVVNFITRKNVQGFELSAQYGQTAKSDGKNKTVTGTFGTSTDNMSIIVGGSYSKQDEVFAGARDFSKYALYFYGGSTGVTKGGSSRVPTGRIFTNPTGITDPSTGDPCTSLTRISTASGATADAANYRCYNSHGDAFNYQPYNLLMTPLERGALFSKVNYKINDHVEAYFNVLYNRTHSGFHIAPLPFDSQADDIVLSAQSIYNPFGVDLGGISGANPDFTLRTTAFGDRKSDTVSDSKILNGGAKGEIGTTGWNWDLNLSYSRLDQHASVTGYYLHPGLQAAVGPSFFDPTNGGAPTCGTPTAPISGCIPVNLFNPYSAAQIAAIQSVSANYNTFLTSTYKAASLDFNGKVLSLPAGDLQAAVGYVHDDRYQTFRADSIVIATPPLYLQCQLSNETCTGNTTGGYFSNQFYLELYVPLLKDLPAVHSLSFDYGLRYSNYQIFGSTTRSDFKLEWRPIRDLLVRGTYSQIFRVPTINDIAAAPTNSSITFNDPCSNLTTAQLTGPNGANYAKTCQGVAPDTGFSQPNGQITGLITPNANLSPETGHVYTYGLIWEPSQLQGLSFDIDFWNYEIDGLITQVDPNFSVNQCLATGEDKFCALNHRYTSGPSSGQILVFEQPTLNLGTLKTNGIDYGIGYNLKDTAAGSWNFRLDATYISKYENAPGGVAAPIDALGTYSTQYGNIAQWRGLGSIGWSMKQFDALLTMRYIDSIEVRHPTVTGLDPNGVPYAPGTEPPLQIPSFTYFDFSVGINLPYNTRFQAGVKNLTDKQAPVLYQNNVTNANTDVNTYDTLGRQWFVGVSAKF